MVSLSGKSNLKKTQFEHASKRPLCRFGEVNFNMSNVIGVVFLLVEYGPFDWSFFTSQISVHMKKNCGK